MHIGSPFDALHEALANATSIDLPDIAYWQRDWTAYRALPPEKTARLGPTDGPGRWEKRRPYTDETRVIMIPQTWGSTALGYGGVGGAAWTPAYTVIVTHHNVSCIYFGCSRLAYKIDGSKQSLDGQKRFKSDICEGAIVPCGEESRYY
jgi:hypothetical protein